MGWRFYLLGLIGIVINLAGAQVFWRSFYGSLPFLGPM